MKAEQIRAMRQASGLSVRKFAQRLGVAPSTVFLWEKGTRNPKGTSLQALERFSGSESKTVVEVTAFEDLGDGVFTPHIRICHTGPEGTKEEGYWATKWGVFDTREEAVKFGRRKVRGVMKERHPGVKYEIATDPP